MFPIPTWSLVKAAWPALLFIVLAIVALVVAAVFAVRGCGTTVDDGPDYLEDVKRQILNDVEETRKANEAKIKALEAEMYDLRFQVETLDEEVQESAKVREEIHDAIDHASTIDDIDRILRGGIPGVSGRHD